MSDLYYGWLTLGRDMNGATLYTERESWLTANGWIDPGDRDAGHYLFACLESASSEILNELYPPTT